MLKAFRIDPLCDPRWPEFLNRHPAASVFHTPGWLDALHRTYGYQPVALATSGADQDLGSAMVFCWVDSLLTGRRLVSVPFADHCEPLVASQEDLKAILECLQQEFRTARPRYVELRPRSLDWAPGPAFARSEDFYFHTLDLRPEASQLIRSFHKDSVQRQIRRAEREKLIYEEGRSEALLEKFYRLLLLTRRRHQLPPQPREWFRNLTTSFGEAFKIRVAAKGEEPVASIITLRHGRALVYKYGCSDPRFHNLGGMALLFWMAIQEAKQAGLQEFDLGRSDADNVGLVTYKDHWGTTRSTLTYLRNPPRPSQGTVERYGMQLARRAFARAPHAVLRLAGRLLYKHIG
jgi:CelD/BcsL family acetyltransferase involved in cellulose biosynthesis